MSLPKWKGFCCLLLQPLLVLLLCMFPKIGHTTAVVIAKESSSEVILQLPWINQFQFAGYYAALEKGYYKEAELRVIIKGWQPDISPVTEVLSGRANFGVGRADLLLHRLHGKPVVVLGAIFQHSPSIFLMKKTSNITSPQDMVGRRVMMLKGDDSAEFMAMFKNEGVLPDQINMVPVSYDINDLIEGKTDAFFAYSTNEPYFLKQKNIPFTSISPRSYGIDFYGDCLFTSEQETDINPEQVKAFRAESFRGWEYAMQHPEEIVDLLISKYHVNKSREHLLFEADAMRRLILPDLVATGHMNPGRWQHMADTYVALGMAESSDFTKKFIFNPDLQPDLFWNAKTVNIICALLGLITAGVCLLWFANHRLKQLVLQKTTTLHKTNQELSNEILQRKCIEKELKEYQENLENIIQKKISDIEKEKEKAEAANMAKSVFLANMSHEIRTPMNAIIGMNRLAIEAEGIEEQQQYLLTVQNSSESLLALLNDILDFSKIEAGQLDLVNSEFNLLLILDESCRSLQYSAYQKGLELVYYQDPAIQHRLLGDPGRLKQILLNLLGNAIKFTQTGHVFLAVELENEENNQCTVRFEIEDTGIGISPDRCEEIFDSFTQADSSVSRDYGGTGLGLTISRKLVSMMGGKLQVESRVDHGSRFSFSLLFEKGESVSNRIHFSKKELAQTILLATPYPLCKKIVTKHLEACGFTLQTAMTNNDIVKTLLTCDSQSAPGLLILEHHPPGYDCAAVIKQIKENTECPEPAKIILQNLVDNTICRRCSDFGITACLDRPVNVQMLEKAIVAALGGEICSGRTKNNSENEKMSTGILPLRILLVEDNHAGQELAAIFLRQNGYQVTVADNGLIALQRLCDEEFEIILMDVQMPVMDGFTAVRYIRQCEKGSIKTDRLYNDLLQRLSGKIKDTHIPIVAITAHAMVGDRERCLAVGMDNYLTKPFQPEITMALLESIAETLPYLHKQDRPDLHESLESKGNNVADSGDGNMSSAVNHLQKVYSLSEEQVQHLLSVSARSILEALARADKAILRNDLEEIATATHSAKGAILSLGLKEPGELAKKIELTARAGENVAYAELLQKLRNQLAFLKTLIH